MRNVLAVGIVVALLAGALWWLVHDDAFAPLPPGAASPVAASPAEPVAAPATAPVSVTPAAVAPEAATAVERTAVTAPEAPQPQHTLRGRAVDAAGQPLAGIRAGLIGWNGNDQRLAEWTKNNAEPERIDQKATTGPDGVFTFRCWPPPPFQFSLRLQGDAVATWSARWSEWPPGGTTDLGDVKLERGTLLRGRVVDAADAPVAKVEVRIDAARGRASGSNASSGGTESWCTARTRDDGTFVQRWALPAGDYTIGIDNQQIERGEKVALTGEPEQVLDIVLKRIDPGESISGVVVDDAGAPVRNVMIHANTPSDNRILSTDAEGRFRVLKREGAPAEVELSVMARGHEAPEAPTKAAWGTHDVRIVVTRGKELVVTAVNAADGQPVEDYVLRVIPIGGRGFSSMNNDARGKPPHAQGRTTVRGIATGKHRVVVEPRGDAFALGIATVEVGASGAMVTVRLAPTQPRIVRVVAAGNAPIAGAKVQLVDPCGEPWNEMVPVHSFSGSSFSSGPQAMQLAIATTDASGECTLPVPGDRPLALMLPGPGHVPLAVPQAVFPSDGPLVVTVSSGGVLRGTIGPEAAWAELLRLASADGAAPRGSFLPSVTLHRGEGRASEQFPRVRTRQTAKPDGSFEITGIPTGRWNLLVNYFTRQGDSGGFGSKQEPGGEVDVVDGQTTTTAVDLSGVLPGTLDALVMHDGAPLANTPIVFERLVPGAQWPEHERSQTTDAAGRLHGLLRRGEYRVAWQPQGNQASPVLRSLETAAVRTGQTTNQTFTIVAGTVRLRLVDHGGAPVANTHIGLTDAAGTDTEGWGASGADGRIEQRYPTGTFTAWVMPKRLQDQKAAMDFYRTNPDLAAMQSVRVKLGTITVTAGGTSELDLKLPADW